MKNPKISVIMSEYNTKPKYLDIAIKSILNQTFKDFELIIVDDCGFNDVEKIAKEYKDKRIKVIKNNTNMGTAYSKNKAVKISKANYIAIMDTDDIALPTRIEQTYNFIVNNPQYDVVSSRVLEFGDNQEYGIMGKSGEKNNKNIIMGDFPIHGAAIIKKASILKVGGYNNYYRKSQDYVLWCDLILDNCRFYMLNDVLYRYRVNLEDYKKRKLTQRKYELRASFIYYPKLGASIWDYRYIAKSIIAGILPSRFVYHYRHKFALKKIN
jgi:glycosyltransferase involved in cell wall biosynthesis